MPAIIGGTGFEEYADLAAVTPAALATFQGQDQSMLCRPRGVYACTQGPRQEKAAAIWRMARDGCTIAGMGRVCQALSIFLERRDQAGGPV